MALITGINGYLSLAGARVASLGQWQIELDADVKSEQHSDSGGWDELAGGGNHWNGTFRTNAISGAMPSALAAAIVAKTLLAFVGYTTTGVTYSSAVPAGTSLGHGVMLEKARVMADVQTGAVVQFEWTFKGQGALTPTIA